MTDIKGSLDSVTYWKVLQNDLLPLAVETMGENWIFQQEGAPGCRANCTKEWFKNDEFDVLERPAKSNDFNNIENVWGVMVRKVYRSGKQFDNLDELINRVVDVWESLSEEYLRNIYKSIPRRLVEVIKKKEDSTKY